MREYLGEIFEALMLNLDRLGEDNLANLAIAIVHELESRASEARKK